jgi:hypothetical protein
MKENTEQFYAVHYDESPHLHVYNSRAEAQQEIDAYAQYSDGERVGPTIYPASELIFILAQTQPLRELAVSAAEAVMLYPGSPITQPLKPLVRTLAEGVVTAFKEGRLDSSTTDEQTDGLTQAVAARDEIVGGSFGLGSLIADLADAARFINAQVRVVDSTYREDRADITPLVGRVFDVEAYNPVTKEVRILPPDGYGSEPLTISEDEYIVTGTAK